MPPFCYLRVHLSFLPHSSTSQIALSFNSLAPFVHYSISTDLPYFSSNFFIPLGPFSHYIFSQELPTNRNLSHHSPNSLNPVLSLFLTFILTFLPPPPPQSYFHCPLTRPLPLVLLGAKAKRVSN